MDRKKPGFLIFRGGKNPVFSVFQSITHTTGFFPSKKPGFFGKNPVFLVFCGFFVLG